MEKNDERTRKTTNNRSIIALLDLYVDYMQQAGKSRKTITNRKAIIKDFIRFYAVNPQYIYGTDENPIIMGYIHPLIQIPEYLYDDYSPRDVGCIEGYLQTKRGMINLHRINCTEKTVLTCRAVLFNFHDFCYRVGLIAKNPMQRNTKQDTMKKKTEENTIIKTELLMKNPRDKILVMLLYATGARLSELCNLRIENIDLDAGTMTVYTPRGKSRAVYCDEAALKQLKDYLKGRTEGYVFLGSKGKALTPRAAQYIIQHAGTGLTPQMITNTHNIKIRQQPLIRKYQMRIPPSSQKDRDYIDYFEENAEKNISK